MLIRFNALAALFISAAFVFSPLSQAQAPVVDASVEKSGVANTNATQPQYTDTYPQVVSEPSANVSRQAAPASSQGAAQGDLLNQLQLLQQEVMQLRGIVEEQTFQLKQLKEQSMERYIDMDRRLGELSGNPSPASANRGVRPADTTTAAPARSSGGISVIAQAGEKEAYDAAYSLVVNKRFDDALAAFKQFVEDFPAGKFTPNSYYWLGELYQVVKPQNLEGARQAFTQLLDQYPDNSKAPDAMYKLGKVYFLKGDKQKSRQWLEKVTSTYSPGTNVSADKARQFLQDNF